jgi:transcriptional regulator with XRE-family HTH domain
VVASFRVRQAGRGGSLSKQAFSENLRLLCSYYDSVSEVCRRLGINRQQFNKYLAGRSVPSHHNLRLICDFFSVEEGEIFLPPRRFSEIVDLRPKRRNKDESQPIHFKQIELLRHLSGNQIENYLGYYYRYFYSYGFPGRIVKSLLGIYCKDNVYYSKNIGFLSDRKDGQRNVVHFKYLGLPFLINDRIFLFEYESIIRDMLSGTILYTAYRNRVDILSGVQCTYAGRRSREPAAGKVVMEFLGRQINVRRALRSCGLFAHDSNEVPAAIRQRLDNHIAPDAFVLLVSEE